MKTIRVLIAITLFFSLAELSFGNSSPTASEEKVSGSRQFVLNVQFYFIVDGATPSLPDPGSAHFWQEYQAFEAPMLDAIALLNRNFNKANIFFKYMGSNRSHYPDLLNINAADFYIRAHTQYPRHANAINIYLANTINGGLQAALSACGYTYIAISKDCLNSATLLEAVAHSLSIHPQANHSWSINNCLAEAEGVALSCRAKAVGENAISLEQLEAIRNSLAKDAKGRFANIFNTIDALYMPYTGYPGGAFTSRITRRPVRFQKGFDYQFVDPNNHRKVIYSFSVHETPADLPHNLDIKILQVSPDQAYNFFVPRP